MYNTMNNPSAHPSYSHYYLLSPSTLFFVFFFCTSYCFFAHLVVFLHISLSFAHLIVFCTIIVFCTSYCFALFYFIAHFILISPFLTICMPLCYVTYIFCILIVLHCHWADLIRLHFTSSYALYNYYVTNKETLTLTLTLKFWCGEVQANWSKADKFSAGSLCRLISLLIRNCINSLVHITLFTLIYLDFDQYKQYNISI